MEETTTAKRKAESATELWKLLLTDMARMVEIYQQYAMGFVRCMKPKVMGVGVLDMDDVAKPASLSQSIQNLMTAFTLEAHQRCFDDAFDEHDYHVAEELCRGSRILRAHFFDAANDDAPLTGPKKSAAEKLVQKAEELLSMWEGMTSFSDEQKEIIEGLSDDPDQQKQQFVDMIFADRECISVQMIETYIGGAQVCRAKELLKELLQEVTDLTKRVASAHDELDELWKKEQKEL